MQQETNHPRSLPHELDPDDAIGRLRREARTAVVPGDVRVWGESVEQHATATLMALATRTREGGLLHHIERLEPELAHRVQTVREAYDSLIQDLRQLSASVRKTSLTAIAARKARRRSPISWRRTDWPTVVGL